MYLYDTTGTSIIGACFYVVVTRSGLFEEQKNHTYTYVAFGGFVHENFIFWKTFVKRQDDISKFGSEKNKIHRNTFVFLTSYSS